MDEMSESRLLAVIRQLKTGMPEHNLGRQRIDSQQLLRAVEVAENQVEQLGTLPQPSRNGFPFLSLDEKRNWIEGPSAISAAQIVHLR